MDFFGFVFVALGAYISKNVMTVKRINMYLFLSFGVLLIVGHRKFQRLKVLF